MTYWEALYTLHTHFCLSDRRNPKWQANNAGRYLYYVLAVFVCVYMGWAGAEMADLVASSDIGGYRFIYALLPLLLFFDYFFRYASDNRRLMQVLPYLLLPLPENIYADYLVVRQLTDFKNTFFLFLCIPFGLKTVVPESGLGAMAGYTVGLYLLLLVNGQFFQITQVLIAHRIYYWLLPTAVYLSAAATIFFFPTPRSYVDSFGVIGNALMTWNLWVYTALFSLLFLLADLNRRVLQWQIRHEQYLTPAAVYMKEAPLPLTFFERFHLLGEYFKLETRSILRNKRLRYIFIADTAFIILYALSACFGIGVGNGENHFFLFYCFTIYGIAFLTRIMSVEGNYFECLLMQRNSLYTLLLAKYYFYAALLLLPVLLLLPAAILGTISPWTIIAYALYTAGVCYRILFHMAVYNKVAQPLNTVHTGKRSGTPYLLSVVPFLVLFSPFPVIALGSWWLGRPLLTHTVLSLLGCSFIFTHRRWIGRICGKMKERQYEQIEGFRISR